MASNKKRTLEHGATGIAVSKPAAREDHGGSSNIEEKNVLRDLEDLDGTVLAVWGPGEVKEVKLKVGGQLKPVFKAHANDANHEYVGIEAWGLKAATILRDWMMHMFEQSGNHDVLAAFFPSAKAGARFVKKPASKYQSDAGFSYILAFEVPEGPSVTPVTAESLPKLFEWKDDAFQMKGRPLDHFKNWNVPLIRASTVVVPNLVLEMVSFDMSPKKPRREMNTSAQADAAALDLMDD